jgi:tripartite-type tricarboxylate transporter receptor subunit TctC
MLNLLAGIKLTHVPTRARAGAARRHRRQRAADHHLADSAGAHMNAGRVRALATTGAVRNPALPELPTIADAVPGYEISQSWGIVAPAGTPPQIVKRLTTRSSRR